MSPQVRAAFDLLPEYLAWHVLLSAAALALGVAVSLPLAVAAARRPALRWPLLGGVGVVQTIPSLALLALFFPLLLALSALSIQATGRGFSALGFLPALLALTLYSMLPVVRNTITGLAGLDPAVIEAADGVGMTPGQRLRLVELPLAAPVIMAGVRTAAVWTIGAATLSTPVGQTSLGNYIFAGLQTENWVFVLFGCAASAALALAADQLLGLIEKGAARRSPRMATAGAAGLVAGVLLALLPLASFGGPAAYVVGAKNFSEQYILAELMAGRLEAAGANVRRKEDLGSAIAYRALASGEIDAYVDYSGTLWANVLGRTDNPGREQVLAELTRELKARDGVLVLGSLGFENAYALAMRQDRARALGIASIADLSRHAPQLVMGADLEFFSRPEWKAVENAYGLRFRARRTFQPTFMYRALARDADVISAFSSDGRIAADRLVVLTDPRGALPPYDAVILISPRRTGDRRLLEALRPLVGAIPVEAMREANFRVDRDRDKATPAEAAEALSAKLGL
ncbi:MAG: glycine betaine ABC transporter substrate-binding protein [Phenylobacterium sp.]|jgi:osmoprotectant transport system permease protein|uniref:glycine betaine ABC transporter substrate-binding protein n=1 Tax=Phenylobacterium sp. TaxID=1871053 RepID=UPI002A36C7D2|nr:glycine betaine ABC transporter substrate-binding protein [Phenylobacterium sp.]MDX9999038.1 glycine betaine ABC transporter substrate-binding protein [Phenylobacterium sp.]